MKNLRWGLYFSSIVALFFVAHYASAALTVAVNSVTSDSVLTLGATGGEIISNPIGLMGTTVDANKYSYLLKSASLSATTHGQNITITNTGDAALYGILTSATASSTTTSATYGASHTGAISGAASGLALASGVQNTGSFSGSGTALSITGSENLASITGAGGGGVTTVYGSFNQVQTLSSSSVTTAHAVYGKVFGFNGTMVTGNAVTAAIQKSAGETLGTAVGLNLSSWATAGTPATNSYAIYADNTIGIGTSNYFIYSLSTSPSLFSGPVNYGTTAGSTTAYTLAIPVTALTDGMTVTFKANAASTGSSTLNVNSLGAKKLLKGSDNATQIGSGELVLNGSYMAIYNSSLDSAAGAWVVLNK